MTAYPNSLRSTFVGFDTLFNVLDNRIEADKYPPHNLVSVSDDLSVIELAVAGFEEDEIELELDKSILTINGEKTDTDSKKTYVYQGIAFRKFTKVFRLAEYVKIREASLSNGILSIHLERVIPESEKPQKIKINK
jgi:molecular chaperone IbpA